MHEVIVTGVHLVSCKQHEQIPYA